MTLPALLDVCVPSPAFLRVWLLEGKKLSRILRGNQQTLRLIAFDFLHAHEWCCNENTERWWWKKHVKLFIVLYVGLKSFFSCRKLKLGNGTEVCVQRLMKEEDLRWDFLTAIQIMRRLIKSKEEWNCVLQFEKHWSFFSLYLYSLKDLLLRVQIGVPGEKAYYPSEEFLWDAGRDGTPRGLYAALASQYGLTPDNLLLAKHLPDKHTWMPISNWVRRS